MEAQETKTYILEDMRKLARQAYAGISFDPEKRGDAVVRDYSNELEEDLKKIPEVEKARYIQNYRKYLSAFLSAKSRCLSTMITGPSNFNVRRNEKANRSEDNRYTEFVEWRKRALAAIAKAVLANRTPQEVSDDKWKSIKKSILDSAAMVIAIDTKSEGGRGYSKPLFVNSLTGLIKRVAEDGDTENLKRSLDYVRELNTLAMEKYGSPKPVITGTNAIWGLEQVAEAAREQKVDEANRENSIESIGNVQIVKNYQIDRLQIIFPSKPDEAVRTKLKREAFKWSPTQGVWQRQLTGNAEMAAKRVLQEG